METAVATPIPATSSSSLAHKTKSSTLAGKDDPVPHAIPIEKKVLVAKDVKVTSLPVAEDVDENPTLTAIASLVVPCETGNK